MAIGVERRSDRRTAEGLLDNLPPSADWALVVYWDPGIAPTALRTSPYECLICFKSMFGTRGALELHSYDGDRKGLL